MLFPLMSSLNNNKKIHQGQRNHRGVKFIRHTDVSYHREAFRHLVLGEEFGGWRQTQASVSHLLFELPFI